MGIKYFEDYGGIYRPRYTHTDEIKRANTFASVKDITLQWVRERVDDQGEDKKK